MATRLQIAQLGVVTDIREMRLQRLLTESLVAFELAGTELQMAERQIAQRQRDFDEAAIDFFRCPQSETVRVWYDVCQQRLVSARQDLERTQIELEEARARLAAARRDVRRVQERGKHIVTMGKSLRQQELRRAEARVDDDLPAITPARFDLETG